MALIDIVNDGSRPGDCKIRTTKRSQSSYGNRQKHIRTSVKSTNNSRTRISHGLSRCAELVKIMHSSHDEETSGACNNRDIKARISHIRSPSFTPNNPGIKYPLPPAPSHFIYEYIIYYLLPPLTNSTGTGVTVQVQRPEAGTGTGLQMTL